MTQQGVRVDKARANFLLFTILSSDNGEFDPIALGDYASRTVLPERPPRVSYALTPLGRSLEPVIEAIERWAADHRSELDG